MPFIIDAFHPADAIAAAGKFIRTHRLKRHACAAFHFRFEDVRPDALQRIFGFGVFTIGTVAPVALRRHHRFGYRQGMLQRNVAKLGRGARVGFLVAVLNGQTAAHQQVKADQLAVFGNGDEVHVVRVQIDIVLRRHHHGGFELTRQIGRAEDRFFVGGRHFLLIEPDLRIGAGARQQMLRELLRPLVSFGMQLRLDRVRGAEHVTVHVVGGRQRVKPDGMQHLMRRLDVFLQQAVILERLAVGQTNAAVNRVFFSEFVDSQPLLRRHDAARQTAAQHHRLTRLQLLGRTLGADIAVILLIHAVKADQQKVVAIKPAGQPVM